MVHKVGDVAGAVGKGLAAGLIGTAAMTVSSSIEAKLRDREPSSAPADAAGKVLGIQPRDEAGKARFSNVVHWAYGTSWGALRGLLGAAGLGGLSGSVVHWGAVWGSDLVTLPKLDVAPPVKEWGGKELAIDGFHHAVYATATGLAFVFLQRHSTA